MECPASGFLKVDLGTEFTDCCPGIGLTGKLRNGCFLNFNIIFVRKYTPDIHAHHSQESQ